MQQYYFEGELKDNLVIDDNLFHYLKNVIKIKKGEYILLFNGFNKAQYKVEEFEKKSIELCKISDYEIEKTNVNITLLTGLLKKNNTDLVIQKTVELGVNNIILSKMKNNVVKWDLKEEKKIKRYQEIVLSAVNQSKGDFIPELSYCDELKKLDFEVYDNIFLLYEKEESSNSLIKFLNKVDIESKILLIIGPEGGFDNSELEYFMEQGAQKASLSNNILRSETAAIFSVGLTYNMLKEKE